MRFGSRRRQHTPGWYSPFPDDSTGYCEICHIGVTKIDGLWAATPTALSQ